MNNRKGLGAIILCMSIMMTNIQTFASADYPEYSAEITAAPNGADAIVSMTFDDGIYDTAAFLNKMFKKYDLKGSCMMITDRITDSNLGDWQALFAEGYLEPQSHTATHMPLPTDKWAEANKEKWPTVLNNNTPENYQKEIVDSKTKLEKSFGGDVVAFAPSNNTLSDGAYDVVKKTYYAVRSGSRGVQSLSPTFGIESGDWHNLYMRAFGDVKKTDDDEKAAGLKKFVDSAVSGKGWLVTLCHSIKADGGDATEAAAEQLFSYISDYQRAGKLQSMTFGDAVKYVRERQQSTVREFENGDGLFVNVTMNPQTEDGLTLDADVFSYPLTVRVQLPNGWEAVSYSLNGDEKRAETFASSGVTYAYVDVAPNSGDVMLRQAQQPDKTTVSGGAVSGASDVFSTDEKGGITLIGGSNASAAVSGNGIEFNQLDATAKGDARIQSVNFGKKSGTTVIEFDYSAIRSNTNLYMKYGQEWTKGKTDILPLQKDASKGAVNYKIAIDFDNSRVTVYKNGALLPEAATALNADSNTSTSYILFYIENMAALNGKNGWAKIDNFTVYEANGAFMGEPTDGGAAFNLPIDETLSSAEVDGQSAALVRMTKGERVINTYYADCSDLAAGVHEVKISAVPIGGTREDAKTVAYSVTIPEPLELSEIVIDRAAGKASVTAKNNTSTAKKMTMIIAEYDAAGKLVRIAAEVKTAAVSENAQSFEIALSGVSAANTLKAFVWDSLNGMKPFAEAK